MSEGSPIWQSQLAKDYLRGCAVYFPYLFLGVLLLHLGLLPDPLPLIWLLVGVVGWLVYIGVNAKRRGEHA